MTDILLKNQVHQLTMENKKLNDDLLILKCAVTGGPNQHSYFNFDCLNFPERPSMDVCINVARKQRVL